MNMEKFQSMMDIVVFQNRLQQYLLALGIFILTLSLLVVLKEGFCRKLGKLTAKTLNTIDDLIVNLISKISFPVLAIASIYISTLFLHLSVFISNLIRYSAVVIVTFQAIVLSLDILKYIIEEAYQRKKKTEDPAVESMAKSIFNALRWVIWGVGTIFVLDNLGINVSALLAGIGIGGIAVAMASQTILGDLFSAVSILVDKPFQVGDFIIIDDYMGTIEHIGLKTTRIRSLSGEQLVFANSDLTKSRIKNYKRMETRRVAFRIGIVYQTPIEKVKQIPELIRNIFSQVEDTKLDRVHFQSFGDFSFIYEIVYFVLSTDYNVYMDRQQEINLEIMSVFEEKGIAFAYPTQTLFLAQKNMSI